MKICIISNLYEPHKRGGAEQVVKNNIEGLLDFKHEIVLITTKPFLKPSSLNPSLTPQQPRFKIYRFYPLNIFYYLNDHKHNPIVRLVWNFLDMFNIHSYFMVKKILKTEKPDIVHTHNLKGIGYLIPRVIKSLKIKHIHTLHDIQLASPSGLMIKGKENSWQQNSLPVRIYAHICKKLFGTIKYIISPSKWLLSYYGKKKFFINSKTIVQNNPIKAEKAKSTKIKSGGNFTNLIYIGQIEKHKGIELLLKVFKSIDSNFLKLTIIGEGTMRKKLQSIYRSKNISIEGKLEHAETMKKLEQSDILIMPTLCYENSPNVIVEALLLHKPVITSKIGGTAELVDKHTGLLFEAGNENDLKNKILQALQQKKQNQFDFVLSDERLKKSSQVNYTRELVKIYSKAISEKV